MERHEVHNSKEENPRTATVNAKLYVNAVPGYRKCWFQIHCNGRT